jgi:hypothetical protein
MASIVIWTPESVYDSQAVVCIAQKILKYYGFNIEIVEATKQAWNQAIKEPDGLKRAVDIYLKQHELVIFLIDADGVQSQTQRRQEPNSLINRIKRVVAQSKDRALLILMREELEAWLLADCLGICCYFTQSEETRNNPDWIKFAQKNQRGDTHLITEAEPGGKNSKEYLINFSKKILKKINPKLKEQDLKKRQYHESLSGEVAKYMEINQQVVNRNSSLREFVQHFSKQAHINE